MSSVHVYKAQPAHRLYRVLANSTTIYLENGSSSSFTADAGDVLADMGKTIILENNQGTLRKVQLIVDGGAGDGPTGYIVMGDGSLAASAVAVLL
jgi:hypothetical protein